MQNAEEINRKSPADLTVSWIGSPCHVGRWLCAGPGWAHLTVPAGMWTAKVGSAHSIAVRNGPGSPLGNTTITRLGLSRLGDSRTSPSKPWGHSDRAMSGSRFGPLPWFSPALVQFERISHGEEDLCLCSFTLISSSSVISSQCLESPCPSPRRAAKHPF